MWLLKKLSIRIFMDVQDTRIVTGKAGKTPNLKRGRKSSVLLRKLKGAVKLFFLLVGIQNFNKNTHKLDFKFEIFHFLA